MWKIIKKILKLFKRERSRHIPTNVKRIIKNRADGRCEYCGATGRQLEYEHIYPFSKGGTHKIRNIAHVCFECNRSKGDTDIRDWVNSFPRNKRNKIIRNLKILWRKKNVGRNY